MKRSISASISELANQKPAAKTSDIPKPKRGKKWQNLGIPLQRDEIEELDNIAAVHGVTRSSLMRYAVVEFIREYKTGSVMLETTESSGKGKVVVDPL